MIDFDRHVLAAAVDAFGEIVIYRPGAGLAVGIRGIFDDNFRHVTLDHDGAEIVTVFPALGARASQFPPGGPTLSEAFWIRGRLYRVAAPPEADIEGHLMIRLAFADDNQRLIAPSRPVG